MAFKLKRNRRSNNKSKLLKRLKELKAIKSLTLKEKAEMDRILVLLGKKQINAFYPGFANWINNNNQDEVAVAIYSGDNNLNDLTIGHVTSAAGQYRRGRIANFKK